MTPPECPNTQTAPEESGSEEARLRRKRGCLIATLLVVLVGLPVLMLILNGPGFRNLARFGAIKAAEAQGLSGGLEVAGSLWSGFSLSSIHFAGGEKNPARFEIEEASIRYDAPALIRSAATLNWLNSLVIRKATLVIPLPSPEDTPGTDGVSEKKTPPESTTPDFSPLWNLLESEIQIDDLSVELLTGEDSITIANLALQSLPGKDGFLKIKEISIPGQETIRNVDAKIVKGERRIEIGAISPLPFLSLDKLSVAEPSPANFQGVAVLDLAGGILEATIDAPSRIQVNLKSGTAIDLTRIQLNDEPSGLTGSINTVDLKFEGDFVRPDTWRPGGGITGSNIGWQSYILDTLQLNLAGNRLQLEANRPGATLNATVSAPFQRAASTDALTEIPIDLAANLKVTSLESALKGIADDLSLSGALTLEARDFQIHQGKDLQSGNLLMTTENLAWDSILLSGMQLAANVKSPNQLEIAGDLGLDPANRLQLLAGLDLGSLQYSGEARGEFNTDGRLGDVLTDLGAEGIRGRAFLNWKGNGELEASIHRGSASVGLEKLSVNTGHPINGEILANYEGAAATLTKLQLKTQESDLNGTGSWDGKRFSLPDLSLKRNGAVPLKLSASLPFDPSFDGPYPAQPGEVSLDLVVDGLAPGDLTGFFSESPPLEGKLVGNLTARGSLQGIDVKSDLDFTPEGASLPENSRVTLDLDASGDVNNPESWNANLLAHVSGLRFSDVDLETISLKAETVETTGSKSLHAEVDFNQSSATLNARAALLLEGADNFEALAKRPLDLEGALVVEELETLINELLPEAALPLPLSGSLSVALDDFRFENGSFSRGQATVGSPALTVNDETLDQFAIDAVVKEPDLFDFNAAIRLGENSFFNGAGNYHLKEQTYSGRLDLNADLSSPGKLRKLLNGTAALSLLPESVDVEWAGSGAVKDTKHTGDLNLSAQNLSLASGAEPVDLKLEGNYAEMAANFPVIELNSRPLDLSGALRWENNVLYLEQWTGKNSSRNLLSLSGSLPLDPDKLTGGMWFSEERPIDLSLNVNALAVEPISKLFLAEAPVSGDISLDLALDGTPASLQVSSDVLFDKIVVPQKEKDLPVGRLKLALKAQDARSSVEGSFQHPDINPFIIKAALPFHPADWSTGKRKLLDETISASAKMERSPLDFLKTQVPGIETINGAVAIDVAVAGSLAKPSIKGSGFLDLDRLKMEDRNAPSLRDLDLVARFEDESLILENLSAIVAGGIVEGSGRAKLVAGEDPELDFRINGSEVLVFRSPDVSVRTDAELSLKGPFSSVTVSGELGITGSRFFKNFDLLPVGLPTRTKSVLPTVQKTPRGGGAAYTDLNVGVPVEPFKNWPVDLRIYTKDPFLVRSNLVESALNADLNLSGTLGTPVPNGYVRIDEGELSLPFSSVDVEKGEILFDASTGFNGALEFKARAKADRYRANIYLFNRVLSPKYVLTSNPPLPSEDIMTLLATGSVRSDLVGDDAGSVAASKAAKLFLKNIRKSSAKADRERTLLDDLQDRTELELGGVSPETGDQTFGGKIRLWKQLFFVGDVDAESDYRALLKYVFRFR